MSNSTSEFYYWDASVFLAYLRNEDGRADVIELLLEEASRARNVWIATSSQSIVEVAHIVKSPRPKFITPTQEQQITALLDAPFVRLIEVSFGTYFKARALMRQAIEHEWSLKPYDAVHLSTATWLHANAGHVRAVFSYDEKWPKYTQLLGGITVCQPYLPQLPLGLKS